MSDATNPFAGLEHLSAKGRLIAGICVTLGAIVFTVVLWDAGLLAAFTVLMLLTGVGLIGSGMSGLKREKAEAAQWNRIEREEAALVETLVEMKREGGRPVPWLIRQGFSDRKARNYLLQRADEALGR